MTISFPCPPYMPHGGFWVSYPVNSECVVWLSWMRAGATLRMCLAQSWSCCFSLKGGDVQPSVGTVLAELFQCEQLSSVPAWPCSGGPAGLSPWATRGPCSRRRAVLLAALPEGAAVPVSGGTSVISGDRLPVSSREEQMAQSSCGRIVKRFSKLKG